MRTNCKDCSCHPLPGKRRCAPCGKAHSEREAARREARRRAGLCVVCGTVAELDDEGAPMTLCRRHRLAYETRRLAQKQRRAARQVA